MKTGFFSNNIPNFRNYKEIDFVKSQVRNHRATGMVQKTIGSIKHYVITYLREDGNQKFENITLGTLSSLPLYHMQKSKNHCLRHILEERPTMYFEIS